MCSFFLGVVKERDFLGKLFLSSMNISNINTWSQSTQKLPWLSNLMEVLLRFETLVWDPSPLHFYPLMLAEILLNPAVSRLSCPGTIAWAGVLHSLLSNPLLPAGCLQSWQSSCCGAPAVLNSFNPTVKGRHFGGCDNALRVPFESLVSKLRDFAQRVISLEWLQWL